MEIEETLQAVPALAGLSTAGRAEVLAGARIRVWQKDERLWQQGEPADGLFFLIAGSVRIVRNTTDRQLLLHTVDRRGEPFGEVPLFSGNGYPATAVAAETTTCVVLPDRCLAPAFAADPAFARTLMSGLAGRVEHLVGRLSRLARATVRERLLARLRAEAEVEGSCLLVRYGSHEELAEDIGTAREVVTREIARLRAVGAVQSVGRGCLRIVDPSVFDRPE